jgi:hypothetical protein
MSSAPSNRPPRAAALGCRPDIPLITRSSLRVVPAATCSRAHGGYWLRCTAAPEALMAEPGGAVPGSARRRRRTERPPGGHAPNHRAQQMAAAARRPCLRCHAHRQHSRRSQGQVYSGTNAPDRRIGSDGRCSGLVNFRIHIVQFCADLAWWPPWFHWKRAGNRWRYAGGRGNRLLLELCRCGVTLWCNRTLAPLMRFRGANDRRNRAMCGHIQRLSLQLNGTSGYARRHHTTLRECLLSPGFSRGFGS